MKRRTFLTSLIEVPVTLNLLKDFLADDYSYPLRRKQFWSVQGNFKPTREIVLLHLRTSFNHKEALASWPLEELNLNELQSIHSDHHERSLKRLRG